MRDADAHAGCVFRSEAATHGHDFSGSDPHSSRKISRGARARPVARAAHIFALGEHAWLIRIWLLCFGRDLVLRASAVFRRRHFQPPLDAAAERATPALDFAERTDVAAHAIRHARRGLPAFDGLRPAGERE